MKKLTLIATLLIVSIVVNAQENNQENAGQKLLSNKNNGVTIGGYAQIDYNEKKWT